MPISLRSPLDETPESRQKQPRWSREPAVLPGHHQFEADRGHTNISDEEGETQSKPPLCDQEERPQDGEQDEQNADGPGDMTPPAAWSAQLPFGDESSRRFAPLMANLITKAYPWPDPDIPADIRLISGPELLRGHVLHN